MEVLDDEFDPGGDPLRRALGDMALCDQTAHRSPESHDLGYYPGRVPRLAQIDRTHNIRSIGQMIRFGPYDPYLAPLRELLESPK